MFIDGCQRHCVWLMDLEFDGLLEPACELLQRMGIKVAAMQAFGGVFFAKIGEIHVGAQSNTFTRRVEAQMWDSRELPHFLPLWPLKPLSKAG